MEEKINELTNKYIRLYAEFENYKKRTIKEKAHYHQQSQEQIFKEILPIIDDFERSLEASKSKEQIANEALKQGIELIYNKCQKVLKDFEIEAIEIQIGERFNEETSEAIMQKPIEQGEEAGKIVEILEKGYKQKGKVIRHAKVIIGK